MKERISGFIKSAVSAEVACPIFLVTSFIAAIPEVSAERSGLNIVREEYALIIGAAMLYSGGVLISRALIWLWKFASKRFL